MSLLMHSCTDTTADILVDTLGINEISRDRSHCAKAVVLRRSNVLVAITGIYQVLLEWVNMITDAGVCVDGLAGIAPAELNRLAARWNTDETSTVHHFGYSPNAGRFVVDTFHSAHDFEHVRQPARAGLVLKPTSSLDTSRWNRRDGMSWVEMATEVRDHQNRRDRPSSEKQIHIGGDLIHFTMTPDGTTARRVHTFERINGRRSRLRGTTIS